MLPSAAWDLATSFPWCPRRCKPGTTCPPEAMARIYPGHRRPLEMISSSLLARPHYSPPLHEPRRHSTVGARPTCSLDMKSFVLDPRDIRGDIEAATKHAFAERDALDTGVTRPVDQRNSDRTVKFTSDK